MAVVCTYTIAPVCIATFTVTPLSVATYGIDGDTLIFAETGAALLTEAGATIIVE